MGAGLGANTRFLLHEAVTHWTCIEPDATLAKQLEATLAPERASGRVSCVNGTLADVPATTLYDTLLYVDVLEHIEDDAAELSLAARHLKPGGTLIVLSPAHEFLFSPFDKAIGHHRRYNERSLRQVAPRSLFCVSVRYLDAVGLFASLANRLLLRQASPTPGQVDFWDSRLVPLSERVDALLRHRFGKTVVGVWTREST